MSGPSRKPAPVSWFRRLGPGLITGAADDDPGGIATHSQVGAQFGLNLMWTVALTYPLMTAIQSICARIGRVTGEGLAANMTRVLPRWLVSVIVLLLFVANTVNIGADLAAMGAAVQLVLGWGETLFAILFAAGSLVLQVFLPYHRYVHVLKWLTLSLAGLGTGLWSRFVTPACVPDKRPSSCAAPDSSALRTCVAACCCGRSLGCRHNGTARELKVPVRGGGEDLATTHVRFWTNGEVYPGDRTGPISRTPHRDQPAARPCHPGLASNFHGCKTLTNARQDAYSCFVN